MAEFIVMPKLGFDMREAELVSWLKEEGDAVEKGEVIAEIESDKATLELEAQASGTLLKKLEDVGAIVPVGANIAIIGDEGEDISSMAGAGNGASAPAAAAPVAAEEPAEAEAEAQAPAEDGQAAAQPAAEEAAPAAGDAVGDEFPGGVRATPVARRMAEEHEIDLRQFALKGVKLYGTLADIQRTQASFLPDLKKNLDDADEVYCSIRRDIDNYIAKAGIDAPLEPPFQKAWEPSADPTSLDLREAGITSIVWASGFKANYSWIDLPSFDGRGHPRFTRGVSPVAGLYFLGLPWLHTWGSGRFLSMAKDAQYLVDVIAERRRSASEAASPPAAAAVPA